MLKGTLDDFTLADVFRLLSLAKRTGKLDVERSAGSGRVFFRDGEIYYADSSLTREPLGKKLIRARVVTETQLMKALDQAAAGEGRVGDILVSSGVATTEQLQIAVRQQIEEAVFEMLHWDRGEYSWDPKVQADVEVPIAVSVENLIMEASRRLDELELIKRKIPSEDTIPGMAPSPPEGAAEINITPEEWRILVLIDGRRTVRDISAGSGWDEFTTMRTLYGLVSAGLVEVLGPPGDTSAETSEEVPGFGPVTAPAARSTIEPSQETPAPSLQEIPEPQPAAEVEPQPEIEPEQEIKQPEPEIKQPEPEIEPVGVPEHVLEPDPEHVPEPEPVTEPEPEHVLEPDPEPHVVAEAPTESEPEAITLDRPEPAGEPFLSDLLRAEPEGPAPEVVPAPEGGQAAEVEPHPAPVAVEEGARATADEAFQMEIDRAEMARELSGLFRDDRPAYRPLIPGESEEETEDGPPRPPTPPPVRKRVEDDEQVTKGLISRLIDGVKGL